MIEWENHQWREAKQILGVTVQDGYNISLNGVIGNKNKVYKKRGFFFFFFFFFNCKSRNSKNSNLVDRGQALF